MRSKVATRIAASSAAFFLVSALFFFAQASTAASFSGDDYRDSLVFIKVEGEIEFIDGPFKGQREPFRRSGAGVVITADGYLITAAHLFPPNLVGPPKIEGSLRSRSGTPEPLAYLLADPKSDLALLKFANTAVKRTPTKIGNSFGVRNNVKLWALGFPVGLEFISSPTEKGGEERDQWIVTTALNPGNSGGPVYNENGEVVAIVSSRVKDAEAIVVVTPIHWANDYLIRAGLPPVARPVPSSAVPPIVYDFNKTRPPTNTATPTSEQYTLEFMAKEGLRIKKAELKLKDSKNLSDAQVLTSGDGKRVLLMFRLMSGGEVEQLVGAAIGTVETVQEPN